MRARVRACDKRCDSVIWCAYMPRSTHAVKERTHWDFCSKIYVHCCLICTIIIIDVIVVDAVDIVDVVGGVDVLC